MATLNADNTNKLLVQFIAIDIPYTPKHFTKKEHIMIRGFGILIFVIFPLYCHLCSFVTFYNTHLHVHKYTYTYIYIYIYFCMVLHASKHQRILINRSGIYVIFN